MRCLATNARCKDCEVIFPSPRIMDQWHMDPSKWYRSSYKFPLLILLSSHAVMQSCKTPSHALSCFVHTNFAQLTSLPCLIHTLSCCLFFLSCFLSLLSKQSFNAGFITRTHTRRHETINILASLILFAFLCMNHDGDGHAPRPSNRWGGKHHHEEIFFS